MALKIRISILSLVVFLGSCSSFSVISDYDQEVSFDKYKTYEIRDKDLEMSNLDRNRIISAIKQGMSSKGFEESTSPDIIVNLKASYEVIINIKKISNEKRILLGGYDPFDVTWGWGGPYGGYWGVKWKYKGSPISHRRGGLILDFVDAKSQKLIWQGMGSGVNIDERKAKVKQIPEIVNKILKKFPPKK